MPVSQVIPTGEERPADSRRERLGVEILVLLTLAACTRGEIWGDGMSMDPTVHELWKNRIDPRIEARVLELAVEEPAWGRHRGWMRWPGDVDRRSERVPESRNGRD